MRHMIYIEKNVDGTFRLGDTGDLVQRRRSHDAERRTFVCAWPGEKVDAKRVEKFFRKANDLVHAESTFEGERFAAYAHKLVDFGYASEELALAVKKPALAYEQWGPEHLLPKKRVGLDGAFILFKSTGDEAGGSWCTPPEVMSKILPMYTDGIIGTDPCASFLSYEWMPAKRIWTKDDSGLAPESHWIGPSFVNPPPELAEQFMHKMHGEMRAGRVPWAVTCLNTHSIEAPWLQDLVLPVAAAHVIYKARIDFLRPDGLPSKGFHGTLFSYFGDDPSRFKEVVGALGYYWSNPR